MTAAQLRFAIMTTAYSLASIQLEERDLVTGRGRTDVNFRRHVPMLVPGRTRIDSIAAIRGGLVPALCSGRISPFR